MINPDPVIEVTKTVSVTDNNANGLTDLGDLLTYTLTISNTGNVGINSLSISDTLTDGNTSTLALTTTPTFISATGGSTSLTIAIGGTVIYQATFVINQQGVDSGSVNNTALVTVSSPGQSNNVTDTSDNGNDGDGNTTNDPTVVTITASPSLEVVKSAVVSDVNGNGITDKDDIISYTIGVKNDGNVTLTGLTLVDTITDGNTSTLSLDSGPTFVSATTSSTATLLRVSGVATFTASYTISQGALDSGRVLNSVVATASSPGQTNNVSDTSDNGNDGDGNTTDDKTITTITASPSIEVTKTVTVTDNGDGITGLADIVQYTIAVQNT